MLLASQGFDAIATTSAGIAFSLGTPDYGVADPRLAVSRNEMFAAIDNTVRVPGYARVDGAGFFSLKHGLRLQANIENLFGTTYFMNADSNTNISPGSPRALRLGSTASF